ncbi:MAG: sigma-70 family RNA polymerase sigma factor [Bacteroidota bacterium]
MTMVSPSVLASVRKGNNAAFKELYQACAGYVYAITKRYVSNTSDHPDVIQEIFARVFLSIDTFDPSKGEFKAWLRKLAINQCMQHYRRGKSPRVHVSLEVVSHFSADSEEQFSQLTKEEIMAYLQKMPEGYRQIFLLVVMDGYSHKEAAELLSITPETSRSQLSRAKKWLKAHISPTNKLKILANGL